MENLLVKLLLLFAFLYLSVHVIVDLHSVVYLC